MYFYRHGEIPVYNLFTGQVQPHALQSCEGKAQDVRIWNREENKEGAVVKMASLRQKGNLVCEITAQECGKNLQLTKAISIFIKHRLKHFYKDEKQCSQACHLYVTFQSRTEIFFAELHIFLKNVLWKKCWLLCICGIICVSLETEEWEIPPLRDTFANLEFPQFKSTALWGVMLGVWSSQRVKCCSAETTEHSFEWGKIFLHLRRKKNIQRKLPYRIHSFTT